MHVPKIIFGALHPFRHAAGNRWVDPERIMEHRELYDGFRSTFAASAALLLSSAAANAAQVAALIGGDTIAMVDTAQKKATGSVKVTGISGALFGSTCVRPTACSMDWSTMAPL